MSILTYTRTRAWIHVHTRTCCSFQKHCRRYVEVAHTITIYNIHSCTAYLVRPADVHVYTVEYIICTRDVCCVLLHISKFGIFLNVRIKLYRIVTENIKWAFFKHCLDMPQRFILPLKSPDHLYSTEQT